MDVFGGDPDEGSPLFYSMQEKNDVAVNFINSVKSIGETGMAIEFVEDGGGVTLIELTKDMARLLGIRLTALASRPADTKAHAVFQVKNMQITPMADQGFFVELLLSDVESIPLKLSLPQAKGLFAALQALLSSIEPH